MPVRLNSRLTGGGTFIGTLMGYRKHWPGHAVISVTLPLMPAVKSGVIGPGIGGRLRVVFYLFDDDVIVSCSYLQARML